MTSPPSVTEISVHPKPSDLPTDTLPASMGVTGTPGFSHLLIFEPHRIICASSLCFFLLETTSRPTSDTNICTLVVVIGTLSCAFAALCLMIFSVQSEFEK